MDRTLADGHAAWQRRVAGQAVSAQVLCTAMATVQTILSGVKAIGASVVSWFSGHRESVRWPKSVVCRGGVMVLPTM